MTSRPSPSEAIREACLTAGACAAGFAAVEDLGDASEEYYAAWLSAHRNADMAYLEKYQPLRRNPAGLLEGAQTVVSAAFSYRRAPGTPRHPLVADYALGQDYHDVLRRRLAPVAALIEELFEGAQTRICVDTAPIHERLWAVKAGLGFIGKNAMLTVAACGAGSRVFLAEIITTARIAPDHPAPVTAAEACGDCERCLKACPSGALDGGAGVDARRCLSYNTIENRAETLPRDISLRGRRIYGCDICQDACPYNNAVYTGPYIPEFAPREALYTLRGPSDVIALDHAGYLELFRGSAVRRAKPAMLRRNARRAEGED